MSFDQIVTWMLLPAAVALICGLGAVFLARHISSHK
jgi:hypothetical protein